MAVGPAPQAAAVLRVAIQIVDVLSPLVTSAAAVLEMVAMAVLDTVLIFLVLEVPGVLVEVEVEEITFQQEG